MGEILTPAEQANFLAAKAVASATSFLEGRSDSAALGAAADRLLLDMFAMPHHPDAANMSSAARMLVIVMMRMARCTEPWRLDRWQHIAIALVELVRREAEDLRETGVQRS